MVAITASNDEDLNYYLEKYIGLYFYSNAAEPDRTDTATTGIDGAKNLLYELTPITVTIVDINKLFFEYNLPIDLFFPNSTVSGSGSTNTTIDLVLASAFTERDAISVETPGGFEECVITGISSNTLTITKDLTGNTIIPLAVAPASGTPVKVLCKQIAIKKDSPAGISDIVSDKGFFKEAGVRSDGDFTIPVVRI